MCGIVGYWHVGRGRASEKILHAMLDRIAHRGPDARGVHVSQELGVGHLRLSILDLHPRANQPLFTRDGEGVLVYNGEVYNYRALRRELQQVGVAFQGTSDSEVVLEMLHHFGPARAVPRLNGMFAFAYFDARQQTLWLARDRLGIKPLYLAKRDAGVVFASEMKALFAHPNVACQPDMHAMATQVLHRFLVGQATPYEGVQSVPAGTICRIQQHSLEVTTYFDAVRDLDVQRLNHSNGHSAEDAVGEFRDALTSSVHDQLASDAPLATFCSGGIDSSFVSAIVKEQQPDVVAYVASVAGAFPHGEDATEVGRHLGMTVRRVDLNQEDYLREWPLTVWHNDQPPCQPNDVPLLALARACRRDGIKVVLTGEGADELFGGYRRYAQLYHRQRGPGLFGHFSGWPWQVLAHVTAKASFDGSQGRDSGEKCLVLAPPLQRSETEDLAAVWRRACRDARTPRQIRRRDILDAVAPLRHAGEQAFVACCLNDMYGHLATLLHRNDRMGMATSVECRVPFLDNRLIDLSLQLPVRFKYRRRVSKWVVKAAAASHLPRDVVHAPKQGFKTNRDMWKHGLSLVPNGMLRELCEWSLATTQDVLADVQAHPHLQFLLAGQEMWARLYLRGERPEQLGEQLVAAAAQSSSA